MAYVLSSVSGNLISAASAGYAPTNSGDVSAIASAYQVVSSTATQLYAGTAYVTSINDAPISALRAGNAANASLANSAWYDGTGRLISALPDSAAVSAIASSYVESGVSSKQDTLSFAYNTADQISSINGSALAAGSTYSAGEGIDITDDVISVEAPVDIVAGPGIVIDNPDGNTLRVSTEADAETVLFEDTGSTGTLVANVVLSESSTHFSKLEITLGWTGGGGSPVPGRLIFTCIPDGKGYGFAGFIGKDASAHHIIGGISTNGTTLAIINCLDMYTSNNSSVTYQSFAGTLKVFKVVGIHRIANN